MSNIIEKYLSKKIKSEIKKDIKNSVKNKSRAELLTFFAIEFFKESEKKKK